MTMISMILDAKMVNTGRKDRKIKLEIRRSHFVAQCNKFVKGADRSDQYISYYSLRGKP
jgi:hypothetical protein